MGWTEARPGLGGMRMGSNVLVTHVDLDGYGCEILARKAIPHLDAVFNVNYDDLASTLCDIPRDVHLYITDISIHKDLSGLIEEFQDITIIDHHVSTYWAKDLYKHSGRIDFSISKRRCATYLFGEYLLSKGMIEDSDWLRSWMELVDDHDRYIHAFPESDRLNSLLFITNRARFVDDALTKTPREMLDENKERVDRYLTSQAEYIKQTTYTKISDDDGPSVYLAYAEKFKSKIAQDLMQREGADLVFVLDMRLRQGSIRSTKDSCIDCSKVAKLIAEDGGGHLNASGFQISDEMFLKGFSYIEGKLSEQIDGWKGLPKYDASENEDGDEE